ncbi:MAG TPA: DUF190 domain-containing protein [Methanobacterium sp.]|nr:DUF190 domain-containing protein [Methanobacterium sp.]
MKEESEAILLKIFIGESDRYNGKPLYRYLLEMFKNEGLAGATVLRAIGGFGKTSYIHSTAILQLSTDLPVVIEVIDTKEKIEMIKDKLEGIIKGGIITEERVNVIFYKGKEEQ